MSDFVEWSGIGYSGIYYDDRSRKYSTTLSDLQGIKFDTIEETRDWLQCLFDSKPINDRDEGEGKQYGSKL